MRAASWISVLAICAQVLQAAPHTSRYRADRLIIFPKQGSSSPKLEKMHGRQGRRVLGAYHTLGDLQVIQLAPGEKVEDAAQQYISSGLVEFAEPDYKLHAAATPNDPEFAANQWSLRNISRPGHDINAVAGWDTLTSASNVVVAVVDSGIRYTHDDLAANIWTNPKEIPDNGLDDDGNGIIDDIHGINAINSTGDVMDDQGHGTHVSGIIGAVGNNRIGIAGVAWNVKLMACKFLDSNGDGDTSDAIRCIDYARKNGATLLNASWGGTDFSAALYNAVSNARAAGMILVTAAGNDSDNIDNNPIYPACYNLDNIVVVGGTSQADVLDTSYSSYGANNVDLCAPGSGIYSTYNSWDGAYTFLSGTSMAAPHVTGALALMKARFSSFGPSELIARLYATVDILPALAGKCRTSGRLNLGRALGSEPAASFTASVTSGQPPLAVTFTNTTLGELRTLSWDFGDGSLVSTNQNPPHVFARNGSFTVTLTVVGTNDRTNSVQQQIQVLSTYDIVSADYAWIDPTEMTALHLTDNGVSAPQKLPFDFEFYGEVHSSIYIGANGVLGFNSTGLSTTSNTTLPSSNTPNGIICPYWDNMNPAAGGNVYVGTIGEAPTRRFVVSWVNVPRNSTTVPLTFQAILEEGGNDVVFQYFEVHPETSRGGAKGATVGIEDPTGSSGSLYTFDGNPHVLQNETALRVKPHGYRYLLADTPVVRFEGVRGFPFAVAEKTVEIDNPGTESLDWTAESTGNWLELPTKSGTLGPGETFSIPVNLAATAAQLEAGIYGSVIKLANTTDGGGNTEIPVELVIDEPQALLRLAPTGNNVFSGGLGGPFAPTEIVLQLTNSGNIPVEWTAQSSPDWLWVSSPEGTLSPGESFDVQVSLTPDAEQLPSGTLSGTVVFHNLTDPAASLERTIRLDIRTRVEQNAAQIDHEVFKGTLLVPDGRSYYVEFSDDLQNWQTLNVPISLSAGSLTFQDGAISGTRRFYRVRVE